MQASCVRQNAIRSVGDAYARERNCSEGKPVISEQGLDIAWIEGNRVKTFRGADGDSHILLQDPDARISAAFIVLAPRLRRQVADQVGANQERKAAGR